MTRFPGREGRPAKQAAGAQSPRRSVALDALRGGLVMLMVLYHAAYIAVMSGLVYFELYEGFWWIFPRTIAAGFIAVSGWSLAGKKAKGSGFRPFLVRAVRLALPALAISVISFILFGQGFVFFGILHLLAASSVLAWPFLDRPALALASGFAVLGGGLMLGSRHIDWPYLAWLGFRPANLYPVDYLPLLPWFAWILFGAAARNLVLHQGLGKRLHRGDGQAADHGRITGQQPAIASGNSWEAIFLKPLAFAGRHSLLIYLVHLPALYGLASLLARFTKS